MLTGLQTRYWLFGPETGRKVVLIHGLSVPSLIWKRIAPELAKKGARVLVYGECTRPRLENTSNFSHQTCMDEDTPMPLVHLLNTTPLYTLLN